MSSHKFSGVDGGRYSYVGVNYDDGGASYDLDSYSEEGVLQNLMTFRFLVGLLLYLGLSVSSTYVLSRDYQDRLKVYQEAVQAHQAELKEVKVFSDLKVTLDRRPTPLSIVAQGEDRSFGRSVTVAYDRVPTEATGYEAEPVGQWMLGWITNSFNERNANDGLDNRQKGTSGKYPEL